MSWLMLTSLTYACLFPDNFSGYPTKLPLHAELLAMGDSPPRVVPSVDIPPSTNGVKADPHSYETRQGNYEYESNIGEYGHDCWRGQMMRITGLAVDEHDPSQPMVVVSESRFNFILWFHLFGRLEQAREAGVKIRDVCIGELGSVVASVAEKDYALAKWDSALFQGGVRQENLFRSSSKHRAQVDSEPFGVARDSRGRYVVTVLAKDRVCRWDERRVGDNIFWFGDSGEGETGFNGPYYVAKMSNDFTVVSSTYDHKVKVVDDERELLVKEIGGLGCDLPDLCYPHGVCVDSQDNIYIADTGNFRVLVYDREGTFLCCPVSETWNYGRDVKPTNVAVMRDGRLLVAMQGREYCQVHVYRPKRERKDSEDCDCDCNWFKCLTRLCCVSPVDYESLD